ncbi:hypothetical protein [Mucilaginibacter lappiensis]|uniref:Uncharacterized protein YlxW (UPF0749 family) n=1 Tax=Mucilaginibacter lappiensis TaxID=354630 RepID=A0A841JJI3_9SPHI|nr:hypothetical protein [Mucilaginibacter lappiensis]MBB6131339.1 uncharacterized protein YlxW (UPF0749 family) [Mucilaginibacter lappiensis]
MTVLGLVASTIGAVFTGGVFKTFVDRFSMTKNEQYNALVMLVEQLQRNVNENNHEITLLKNDVKDWREKYYKELEEKNKLALEVSKLSSQLKIFNKNHTD